MKIGIFDSGIGGLSVLYEAMHLLPHEQFIYYADEKHVPYGEKTKEEIIGYVDEIIQFMIERDCKAIVIACNTATSAAVSIMRKKYHIPIIGMEPAVKGKKMLDLVERVDKDHLVDLVALPKLVRFAERLEFESEDVLAYLKEALSCFDFEEYGSLVLGCTHFNYFKDSFHKLLPQVHLLDGNLGTINYLIKNIELEDLESSVEYYYSGQRVLGKELQRIECYLKRLEKMKDIGK